MRPIPSLLTFGNVCGFQILFPENPPNFGDHSFSPVGFFDILSRVFPFTGMKLITNVVVFVCLTSFVQSDSAERVALVIGVNHYEKLPGDAQLQVAVSDAELMASSLKALDPAFRVTLLTDVEQDTADEKFEEFLKQAAGAECALLYFAGHGIEYHGANYLLVKDTAISEISPDVELMKRRLGREALSLQAMVDSLDLTGAQVKLVILDCCRDNPLTAAVPGGSRSVVGGRSGLAQVAAPSGTLISYSADAGQKANDGLFTAVLVDNLKKPGLTAVQIFATTRDQVREISTQWADEDAKKGLDPEFRRVRHEPAEYTKLNLAGTNFTFSRGVAATPVATGVADSTGGMDDKARIAELEKRLAGTAMVNRQPESPKHGYLGVFFREVDSNMAKALGRQEFNGILVAEVGEKTPAEIGGMKPGDVIIAYNGKPVHGMQQLRLDINNTAPGTDVEFHVFRGGEEARLTVKLGDLDDLLAATTPQKHPGADGGELAAKTIPMAPAVENDEHLFEGVTVADLDEETRSNLQLDKSMEGIVVTSVEHRLPASDAGLSEGMVITEMDLTGVKSAEEAHTILNKFQGDVILLQVYSAGRRDILAIPVKK